MRFQKWFCKASSPRKSKSDSAQCSRSQCWKGPCHQRDTGLSPMLPCASCVTLASHSPVCALAYHLQNGNITSWFCKTGGTMKLSVPLSNISIKWTWPWNLDYCVNKTNKCTQGTQRRACMFTRRSVNVGCHCYYYTTTITTVSLHTALACLQNAFTCRVTETQGCAGAGSWQQLLSLQEFCKLVVKQSYGSVLFSYQKWNDINIFK